MVDVFEKGYTPAEQRSSRHQKRRILRWAAATRSRLPICVLVKPSWISAAAVGWMSFWLPRQVGPYGQVIGVDMTPADA